MIAIAVAACGGRSAKDDCLSVRDPFLRAVKSQVPDSSQLQLAHAEAAYGAFCASVTDDEWSCVRRALDNGVLVPGMCGGTIDRLMRAALDVPDRGPR